MKAVHFGPGKIGRGLIGWLLSESGFEVCFVSRNARQIELLNQRRSYPVILANPEKEVTSVDRVSAIRLDDISAIEHNIMQADIVTTSVGASSLRDIAETVAKGIEHRLMKRPRPLTIIACENAIGGSSLLKKWVYAHLDEKWHAPADELIDFPNTLIDRIVPAQRLADPLAVKVEPFYEWVIQKTEKNSDLTALKGVHLADSLDAYLERKLFTVNTGHCSAAYLGYLHGYRTIQDAMRDPKLRKHVEQVLAETAQLLIMKHGFDPAEHEEYVRKTMARFENPALTDKVLRVGRAPLRKLAPKERLVRPLMQAYKMGISVPHLASAAAAALRFHNKEDLESVILRIAIQQKGAEHVIRRYMKIPDEHPLFGQIMNYYNQLPIRYSSSRTGSTKADESKIKTAQS